MPSPSIEFLRLKCRLDCENENTEIRWLDQCWDDHDPEGNEQECIRVLRTWFGRLHNVKEVDIEGMPERDADFLRERWLTKQPLIKDGGSETLLPLTDRYETLEKDTHGVGFCKDDLEQAPLAVERDDEDEFEVRKTAIFRNAKMWWERMQNNEEVLREAKRQRIS